ncbi:MAG TPA: hypothetical protein VG755_18760 [Nannocystaceae bacterium]|nr:hypothetical protein [Nannocystaceae bacterium]
MAVSLTVVAPACGAGNDRWVTTENSAVDIDWDAVGEAYKDAEGPEDLEQRVNEIYTGDEVISISVKDNDDKSQLVTGFFDKNEDGKVDEGEQIFTIQRDVVGEDKGQYQIAGYGPYSGYHSPIFAIATGMLMGSMMSRMFMPGYTPMYSTPYTTNSARRGALVSHRDSWRQSNPDKFRAQQSKSGRSYGKKGGGFGGGGGPAPRAPSRGGGRFGIAHAPKHVATRLVA